MMTTRKKKGVGFAVSAAGFALCAAVFIGWDVTPEWVASVMNIVAVVAGALGFTFVYPDVD